MSILSAYAPAISPLCHQVNGIRWLWPTPLPPFLHRREPIQLLDYPTDSHGVAAIEESLIDLYEQPTHKWWHPTGIPALCNTPEYGCAHSLRQNDMPLGAHVAVLVLVCGLLKACLAPWKLQLVEATAIVCERWATYR